MTSNAASNFETDGGARDAHILEDKKAVFRQSMRLLEELRLRNEIDAKRVAQEEQRGQTHMAFGTDNKGLQMGINSGSMSGITFGGRGA